MKSATTGELGEGLRRLNKSPCCSRLRRSHALIFEHGHCAGCLERALKVIRSDLDVNNIRTMTIACWHDAHVKLGSYELFNPV